MWVKSSVLGDVRVSHKVHLLPVQVGNACVKEGNTHVNGEGYNASVRSEPCKLRNTTEISRILSFSPILLQTRGIVTGMPQFSSRA